MTSLGGGGNLNRSYIVARRNMCVDFSLLMGIGKFIKDSIPSLVVDGFLEGEGWGALKESDVIHDIYLSFCHAAVDDNLNNLSRPRR